MTRLSERVYSLRAPTGTALKGGCVRTDTVTASTIETLSTGSTSRRRHCVALRRGSFDESFDFQSSSQLASPAAYLQQRGPLNTAPPWRPFALSLFTARSSEQDCGRGRWSGIRLGACRRLSRPIITPLCVNLPYRLCYIPALHAVD